MSVLSTEYGHYKYNSFLLKQQIYIILMNPLRWLNMPSVINLDTICSTYVHK